MHHPHDQWFKALMRVYWERVAAVELERAVHVPPQRIDLAYEPRARVPELGIVDRIAAHGPGILEYFVLQGHRPHRRRHQGLYPQAAQLRP